MAKTIGEATKDFALRQKTNQGFCPVINFKHCVKRVFGCFRPNTLTKKLSSHRQARIISETEDIRAVCQKIRVV